MIHRHLTEELRHLALDYALGFLPAAQGAAIEAHLAEGCELCAGEVRANRNLLDLLTMQQPSAEPPAELRDRLLALIQDDIRERSSPDRGSDVGSDLVPAGWTIVRGGEGEWVASETGKATMKRLSYDDAEQRRIMLVRLEPEGRYPGFRSAGTVELYLLEGDLRVNGAQLGRGDYCAVPAGTVLDDMASPGGCHFLLLRPGFCEMDTGAEGSVAASELIIVRAAEGAWLPGPVPGVTVKPLFTDPIRRTETYLVRARPGSYLPRHRHVAADQTFFLEGDGRMGTLVLEAGDFYRAEAGTVHDVSWTEQGCLCITLASISDVAEGQE